MKLESLGSLGVTCSPGMGHPGVVVTVGVAVSVYLAEDHGHLAVQPDTSLAPGILFSGSISEQSRTTELDYDVTAFLQDWLDSGKATNAQESLAGRAGVHVLVLMASPDGPASGLIHTVQETPGEVPSAALRLPHDIDVLIVATNTDVLLFTPRDGWSRHTAPPLH